MTSCTRATWYGVRWATKISADPGDAPDAIRASESPPAKISTDPAHAQCQGCEHRAVCHGSTLPIPTCRSCAHVTPMMDEQGGWHCSAWGDRIPLDAQRVGCDRHLYHPEIVSFLRPIAGDMKANWIKFQSADGETWINGLPLKEGEPWKQGAVGAITSAAAYAAQPAVDSAMTLYDSVISEISIDSGIPIPKLATGDLTDPDWTQISHAAELFWERWKAQPAKLQQVSQLFDHIDRQYCALIEKASGAL